MFLCNLSDTGSGTSTIATTGSTLKGLAKGLVGAVCRVNRHQEPDFKQIIGPLTGTIEPGEMVLVLGPPGSG
jgi:ABC-type multidrug transport system ATPase subunit